MHRKEAGSITELVRNHPRAVLIVLAFTMGGSLYFYTFTTYMQKYLVNSAIWTKTVTVVMTVALVAYMLHAAGVRRTLRPHRPQEQHAAVHCARHDRAPPILKGLGGVQSPSWRFVLVLMALAIVSFYTSISGVVKAELFPPQSARSASGQLRGGECGVRRHRRICGAVAQVGRP